MRPTVSDRDYGPALGEPMTINAPGMPCHGMRGVVTSLYLATNEATVQAPEGSYTVPWDFRSDRANVHGTWERYRFDKCSCFQCCEAAVQYINDHPDGHGTMAKYRSGCHCDKCRAARARKARVDRARARISVL